MTETFLNINITKNKVLIIMLGSKCQGNAHVCKQLGALHLYFQKCAEVPFHMSYGQINVLLCTFLTPFGYEFYNNNVCRSRGNSVSKRAFHVQ